jgi:cytosine/uracil/thiamine/allantoin permease
MSTIADSHLSNADLAPTGPEEGIRFLESYAAPLLLASSVGLLRRARLNLAELYRPGAGGEYWFSNGYNWRALAAVAAGVIPVLPGFLHAATTEGGAVADPDFLDQLYRYGVFVAFGLSAIAYIGLARAQSGAREPVTATAD